MTNIEKITNIAINNKKDFMYKKEHIPNTIFLDEDTYSIILAEKESHVPTRQPIDFNKFIGLDMIIVKSADDNLKIGLL